MAQQMICVHICDRNTKHTEDQMLDTFLGRAKRPKYPEAWMVLKDGDGLEHHLCPTCKEEHYKRVDKFLAEGKL